MGGEHEVSFHNAKRSPCYYIHQSNKIITETPEDIKHWAKVQATIISFLRRLIRFKEKDVPYDELEKYISTFEKFQKPSEIFYSWYTTDEYSNLGLVLHDITKLLMIAYPGKICACFDRCRLFSEVPFAEYDMCKVPFGDYDTIPAFKFMTINDIFVTDSESGVKSLQSFFDC